MQSRFAGVALGLLALGGAAACQSYSMEGVDPQTIVAVETSQRFTGAKPPVLLIVQDRSGSMNLCFGTEPAGPGESCGIAGQAQEAYRSRMDVSQTVMTDALASHQNDAQYGLILYGIGGDTGCGEANTLVTPTTTTSGADAVRQEYSSNPAIERPEGGTPTTKALKKALDTLVDAGTGQLKDAYAGRAAYAVLVTDGLMNCNAGHAMPCTCSQEIGCGGVPFGQEGNLSDPQLCLDRDDSLQMVEALARAGVKTFVIGLGETFQGQSLAVDVLNALATAGGAPRRDASSGAELNPAFYSAGDRAALQTSIDEILASITAPCEYELSGPVCEGRLIQVKLTIDGVDVPTTCGSSGDATWDFVNGDASRIRFNGALCTRMQSASDVFVSIKGIEASCDGANASVGPACDLSKVQP
jgi:hypothetical protein